MEKNMKKKNIYTYVYIYVKWNYFAVHQKLVQYCKSTIFH